MSALALNDSSLSPLQQFARLDESRRQNLLRTLDDPQKAALAYQWDGWLARPAQAPPAGDWRYWLIMAGRGFGKTRIGAEETRKAARRLEFPNIIGATADDARDIMIEGESGILAICPNHERPIYRPSKRQLEWPNGAKSLIFTADEPERLRGKQHMWVWGDEIAAWRYSEAWDQTKFGLRLGDNPQAVLTTTPRPVPLIRELITDPYTVLTRGRTYDNADNLAQAFVDEIIRKYQGTRLGRQELEGELLDDEGLAYRFSESIHVVPPFDVPASWMRFESMDYGSSDNSATAWMWYAVDYDGNVILIDELYEPGLPSAIVPKVRERRARWSTPDERFLTWADPAIFNPGQTSNKWGAPATVVDEFTELDMPLVRANNDRRAGYIRISELLKIHESRRPPSWATHLQGMFGSPRFFVFNTCGNAIQQLKEAPLEENEPGPLKGPYPGEAVAVNWEHNHHAHASIRYGLMSRPSPSLEPPDPNAHLTPPDSEAVLKARWLERVEQERNNESQSRPFVNV